MKILIAEDEPVVANLERRLLSAYGVCDWAPNGALAVEAFRMALQLESPYDLVTLDIAMPRKDGLEVLREIRDLEEQIGSTENAKVVMVTAYGNRDNVLEAFRDQTDGFLTKPFGADDLRLEIKRLGLLG